MARGTGSGRTGRFDHLDDHHLYQGAVQYVDADLEFAAKVHRRATGRPLHSIREDFCGTALLACEWVKRGAPRTAIGVDLDAGTLAFGREHNVARLGTARDRLTLLRGDVRTVDCEKVEAILALNFSYWIFKTRDELRAYFAHARRGLERGGVFVLDAFGGRESMGTGLDRRVIAAQTLPDGTKLPRYVYRWDQAKFNPVDHAYTCHIHFDLPGGSTREKAFTYDWRFWTLPELRELLVEAGFTSAEVWLDGWDEERRESDGIWKPRKRFEHDAVWVAYVVGHTG
jgi:SAM-dependent methyltransferase